MKYSTGDDMKPRIVQAKAGKWVDRGMRQRKNWIVRYGDMMLVYDTFDHALLGMTDLWTSYTIPPKGLVSFQLVPPTVTSRPMFDVSYDGYDDAHDDEFDDEFDDSLSRDEWAQRCTDCAEQDRCCFAIHAEMDDLT